MSHQRTENLPSKFKMGFKIDGITKDRVEEIKKSLTTTEFDMDVSDSSAAPKIVKTTDENLKFNEKHIDLKNVGTDPSMLNIWANIWLPNKEPSTNLSFTPVNSTSSICKNGILNFINYKYFNNHTKLWEIRSITVVSKQAFIKSTGQNSGLDNTWIPFVIIKGSKMCDEPQFKIFLKKNFLDQSRIESNYKQTYCFFVELATSTKYYIIKKENRGNGNILFDEIEDDSLDKNKKNFFSMKSAVIANVHVDKQETVKKAMDDIIERIGSKLDLTISICLGGGIWEESEIKQRLIPELEKQKWIEQKRKPIKLSDNALFETDDPDEINEWLISEDAKYVADLTGQIEKIEEIKQRQKEKLGAQLNTSAPLSKQYNDNMVQLPGNSSMKV